MDYDDVPPCCLFGPDQGRGPVAIPASAARELQEFSLTKSQPLTAPGKEPTTLSLRSIYSAVTTRNRFRLVPL